MIGQSPETCEIVPFRQGSVELNLQSMREVVDLREYMPMGSGPTSDRNVYWLGSGTFPSDDVAAGHLISLENCCYA